MSLGTSPSDDAPCGVGAVAVHGAAEVAEHDLVGADHPAARVMVRTHHVLSCGHDGEVDTLVALFEDASAEVRRHVGLGPPDERDLPTLQFAHDAIDRCTGCGERGCLGVVLDHPERADHVDGTLVPCVRQVAEQFDEETGPHLIADRHPLGAGRQPGDERGGDPRSRSMAAGRTHQAVRPPVAPRAPGSPALRRRLGARPTS